MDRFSGKVAIVTAATSGIGSAISKMLIQNQINVVGLDINITKLDEMESTLKYGVAKFYSRHCDITNDEEVIAAVKWTTNHLPAIHIVVNNAGVLKRGKITIVKTQDMIETLHTNVLGMCIVTREVIAQMRKSNIAGHIVNICSITGHYMVNKPSLNIYPASKLAVRGLTETLKQELIDEGSLIKVSRVSPGTTETGNTKPGDTKPKLDAGNVADAVFCILNTPPEVQIHELIITRTGTLL